MSLTIPNHLYRGNSLPFQVFFLALTHDLRGMTLRSLPNSMTITIRTFSLTAAAALAVWGLSNVRGPSSISAGPTSSNCQRVIFGAGCFWGVESKFSNIPGVVHTRVGYSGGHTPDPTYEKVCAHGTGHAEVVEVLYDSEQVSFEQLLAVFWSIHDPTTPHQLGPQDGGQYRSAIFCTTSQQEESARASAAHLPIPPHTEIAAAGVFHPAEEYHQRYYEKQGVAGCRN